MKNKDYFIKWFLNLMPLAGVIYGWVLILKGGA